jgi:hypothetical protein
MQFLIIQMFAATILDIFSEVTNKKYIVTSLIKSINEVANITVPFPRRAGHSGLCHFTQVRTSFLSGEDKLFVL